MPQTKILRIAMWSGPRNISTALMRAWGNRPDSVVIDEPFYAYFLKATGKKHPGADEVIATGETDWRKVVARLTGPVPSGKGICFQKQMAHHLLPEVDREWLSGVTNCFLIRDPREVIASYVKKQEDPTLGDLGFVQQNAMRLASSLWNRCFRGRLACARPMAFGRSIGTAKWQDRRHSKRIVRDAKTCQGVCVKFTAAAASVINGFMNIAYINLRLIP